MENLFEAINVEENSEKSDGYFACGGSDVCDVCQSVCGLGSR